MVDLALHVEDWHPAGVCHVADVLVAHLPVALANGDAIKVATHDVADLLGSVPVGDLRGLGLDEGCVSPQLGHPRLEGTPGSRAGEEEQHGQHLVSQQRMSLPSSALPFQLEGNVENCLDLVLGPLLSGDHVTTTQVGLHRSPPLYSTAPRTSASSAMRTTTPL